METKITTSVNQSKKLIELGIDVNTADMRYGYIAPYEYSDRMFDGGYDEVPYPKDFLKKNPNLSENEYDSELPAWSLSALLNLIPNENDNGRNYCYIEVYVGYYTVSYCNNWDGRIFSTKSNKCLLDAAFEMMCYLIENKLI